MYTEKVAGNVCCCIGFVKDRNTSLNVPNTLLKKDIRDVAVSPVQKVYAVLSKNYTAERYSVLERVDKGIDIKKWLFVEEIEKKLERKDLLKQFDEQAGDTLNATKQQTSAGGEEPKGKKRFRK